MVVNMEKWKAHAAMRIEYVYKTMLGTKYVKKMELVVLPQGSVVVEVQFNPPLLTETTKSPGYKAKPFYEAETFPHLWQAGRCHSMESVIGNLEDLDLNPTQVR